MLTQLACVFHFCTHICACFTATKITSSQSSPFALLFPASSQIFTSQQTLCQKNFLRLTPVLPSAVAFAIDAFLGCCGWFWLLGLSWSWSHNIRCPLPQQRWQHSEVAGIAELWRCSPSGYHITPTFYVHFAFAQMFVHVSWLCITPNRISQITLFSPSRICNFHFTTNCNPLTLKLHALVWCSSAPHCNALRMEVQLCTKRTKGYEPNYSQIYPDCCVTLHHDASSSSSSLSWDIPFSGIFVATVRRTLAIIWETLTEFSKLSSKTPELWFAFQQCTIHPSDVENWKMWSDV